MGRKHSKKYKVLIFPAELRDANGERQSLWWDEDVGRGKSLEELDGLKEEMGSARYGAQYMNDVSLLEGVLVGQNDIQYYHQRLALQKFNMYMGVDLAISTKDWADRTAIVPIAVHKVEPYIFVLPYVFERLSFEASKKAIIHWCTRWRPIRIGVETGSYQLAMFQTLIKESHFPFVEIKRGSDSYSRYYETAAFFERGQIFIHPDMIELEQQVLTLGPEMQDDDLIDALHAALLVRQSVDPVARIRVA